ncbi:MAG: biosynthetic arginine decarboxylase, partial [Rhodothermales bacterium]|nr:biosynthetic arginine decarboxylase [Rhodothermales bacterium]
MPRDAVATPVAEEALAAAPPEDVWTPADAERLYHVGAWGEGYFHVNDRGHAAVRPLHGRDVSVDIHEVVEELRRQGVPFPCLVRFQDLLQTRVVELNEAFHAAIAEAGYGGAYNGVYPIKVNQLREVVEDILEAGKPYGFGLECGSKAELVATLALLEDDETLLICNGYKDAEMLRLMLTFGRLGKNVLPVVEKAAEFEQIWRLAQEMKVEPQFGVRVRLAAVGAGKWAESGGDHSKFGVSTPDLLHIVETLEAAGQEGALRLLHFHIGSQIADINAVKAAVKEITRVYAHLRRRGIPVEYLDVGGGLGVNYEAGAIGAPGAIDYSVQEYANAIVYAVRDVCDAEGVAHPTLVSENGRALTAHHSDLVVEVFGASTKPEAEAGFQPAADDPALLHELHRIHELVRLDGADPDRRLRLAELLEAYHDAKEQRQQADALFSYGYLSLEAKACAERLYWSVCRAINGRLHRADPEWLPQELAELDDHLVDQYLCDFSIFQSMLDYWAIGQRFPILPLHRLDEEPRRRATLVDLTCDSDGKVNQFVSPEGEKRYLEVHPLREGEPYVLGVFLMGAYQDILGDTHNLFGAVTEAHVYADATEPGHYYVENIIPGTSV